MIAGNFRIFACGLFFTWATSAGAQETERPFEPLTPEYSDAYDAYTADPSESYVVEPSDAERDPPAPREEEEDPVETREASIEPVPTVGRCHEFKQNVFVRGESVAAEGRVCQQSDGSWRLVSEQTPPSRRPVRARGICREYEQNVAVENRTRVARGKACQREDGSWRIVTAPSLVSRATASRQRPDYGDDGQPTFEYEREDERQDERTWRAFNERRAVDRRRYRDDRY